HGLGALHATGGHHDVAMVGRLARHGLALALARAAGDPAHAVGQYADLGLAHDPIDHPVQDEPDDDAEDHQPEDRERGTDPEVGVLGDLRVAEEVHGG